MCCFSPVPVPSQPNSTRPSLLRFIWPSSSMFLKRDIAASRRRSWNHAW
ncbi:hypothetical protein CSOJ01_04150 [Colletotrichum sojae]|uniref:Uncharacterized protein n=1 Tax=Colletotrichum sojae TaxID=2175907 RepID=A0A8H6JJB7_9PEZI|nr:hypothetical protein CSOJ01_04150 [Colletotrichum sojae]